MKIRCPHCGVKGTVDDSYCERKVKCPKCDSVFAVKSEMGLDMQDDGQTTLTGIKEVTGDSAGAEEPVAGPSHGPPAEPEHEVHDDALPDAELTEDMEVLGEEYAVEKESQTVEAKEDLSLLSELTGIDDKPASYSNLETSEAEKNVSTEDDFSQVARDTEASEITLEHDHIEEQPYGLTREQCWQCGKEDSDGEPFITVDGRLYCTRCLPEDFAAAEKSQQSAEDPKETDPHLDEVEIPYLGFSVVEALKLAWSNTKGSKGAIWGGSAIMYLILLVLFAGEQLLFSSGETAEAGAGQFSVLGYFLEFISSTVAVLFTAGLMYMGIRKVVGDAVSWRMIGKGFSCAGSIIIATILQTLLIMAGFLLLILPGIYLTVGYSMTLPLIVDKGLSPWQAMEQSRKTIHKVWWKVFIVFLLMSLICFLSLLAAVIGFVWTWPMFILLSGVLYCYLFGADKVDE